MTPDLTVQAYDQHAESWAAARSTPGYWEAARLRLQEALPAGGRLVEFGAGAGRDAAELIRAGYGYTGIDASAGLLAIARRQVPGATFIQGDLRTISLSPAEQPFDGFWCVAVLLHLPRTEIGGALENMAGMLRPEAPGIITLKDGTGQGQEVHPEVPTPRHFTYWDERAFRDTLQRCGYTVEWHELMRSEHTTWHQFLVRTPR